MNMHEVLIIVFGEYSESPAKSAIVRAAQPKDGVQTTEGHNKSFVTLTGNAHSLFEHLHAYFGEQSSKTWMDLGMYHGHHQPARRIEIFGTPALPAAV